MALPPCHVMYQFDVDLYTDNLSLPASLGNIGRLNCLLYQRSWDVLLGWNVSTAALFTYLLAHHCRLDPGILVHSIGNAHLYQEHIDAGLVDKLLERKPRIAPKIKIIGRHDNIEDNTYEDIVMEGYYPCPPIRAVMIA